MRFILIFALTSTLWAQEIKRPSASANTSSSGVCVSGSNAGNSTPMPFAYDAGTPPTSTQSSLSKSSGVSGTKWTGRIFTSWATASAPYSALTINVNFACSDSSAGLGECGAEYSTDSGSTWTTLADEPDGTSQATYSHSLSSSQNLSTVQVRICVASTYDTPNSSPTIGTIAVWDIWTSGTLTAAAVPKHRARSY